MKQQIQHWIKNNRNQIESVLRNLAEIIQFITTITERTLWGAAAILAYAFYNATPEETLYSLSQLAHRDYFWAAAFCIAAIYTSVRYAVIGTRRDDLPTAAGGGAAYITGIQTKNDHPKEK